MSYPVTPSSCAAHVPLMFAPAIRDLMVRYLESCIPHTEFGIRKLEFENPPVFIGPNQVHRNLHCPAFSLLTTRMMVR